MKEEIIIEGYRKIISKKNKMKVFRNRLYKTKDVRDFEDYVSEIALKVMEKKKILKVPVSLRLEITFGDKRRRDLQNCFDTICDALNSIVYEDDSQIVSLTGSKKYEKGMWLFRIIVREEEEEEEDVIHATEGR